MAKKRYNPFAGRVESEAQRRELQIENSELYEQREISRQEYEEAAKQINQAYADRQDRAAKGR